MQGSMQRRHAGEHAEEACRGGGQKEASFSQHQAAPGMAGTHFVTVVDVVSAPPAWHASTSWRVCHSFLFSVLCCTGAVQVC
jgi:hypothetical protein